MFCNPGLPVPTTLGLAAKLENHQEFFGMAWLRPTRHSWTTPLSFQYCTGNFGKHLNLYQVENSGFPRNSCPPSFLKKLFAPSRNPWHSKTKTLYFYWKIRLRKLRLWQTPNVASSESCQESKFLTLLSAQSWWASNSANRQIAPCPGRVPSQGASPFSPFHFFQIPPPHFLCDFIWEISKKSQQKAQYSMQKPY